MASAAERARAEEAVAAAADPVHVDPTQVGLSLDEAAAGKEPKVKGVRKDSTGRVMYPWEVPVKHQVGPAGEAARKRKN